MNVNERINHLASRKLIVILFNVPVDVLVVDETRSPLPLPAVHEIHFMVPLVVGVFDRTN